MLLLNINSLNDSSQGGNIQLTSCALSVDQQKVCDTHRKIDYSTGRRRGLVTFCTHAEFD